MREKVHNLCNSSNLPGVETVTRKVQDRHPTAEVMRAAREVFGVKPVAQVAAVADVSERTVKRWNAADAEMALPEYQRLLDTKHGFAFLSAVMRGSNQVWWKLVCNIIAMADARAMQAKANRKIETVLAEALDADTDIRRAISRAEALLVQDEDFHGQNLAHLRAMAGFQARPVAPATKGARK